MVETVIARLWGESNYNGLAQLLRATPPKSLGYFTIASLNILGVACCILKDYRLALLPLGVAYAKNKNDPDIILNLGNCYKDLKEFSNAREIYRGSTHVDADPFIMMGAGICELELKNYDECFRIFEVAKRKFPDHPGIMYNAGRISAKLEQWDEAEKLFKRALEIDASYRSAAFGLAECAAAKGDLAYALGMGEQIIAAKHATSEFVATFVNRLLGNGAPHQALEYFELAEANGSLNEYAYHMAAETARALKDSEKCKTYSRKILELEPKFTAAKVNLYHAYSESAEFEEANKLASEIQSLRNGKESSALCPNPWALFAITEDGEFLLEAAKSYSQEYYGGLQRDPAIKNSTERGSTVKVGFLSADYGNHPVAECVLPLFLNKPEWAEVHAFSLRPVEARDEMTDAIENAVDYFYECKGMAYSEMKELIRVSELDLILDLASFTAGGVPHYMALGLAPIQINYLGYSGSSGFSGYDYIVADSFIAPDSADQNFSESVIRLDNPLMGVALRQPSSIATFKREKYGIPPNKVLFGCIAQVYKYTAQIIEAWAEILKQVNNSAILLAYAPANTQRNIVSTLVELGVEQDQIFFATREESKADHLARLKIVDVFLDTFPYNAHSLAADALSAGVPLVTLAGRSFASRVAGSLLSHLGLDSLVASQVSEYVQTAVELGSNDRLRGELRARLIETLETGSWSRRSSQEIYCKIRDLLGKS